jgi:glyoxylase-like metal-dependent hydrolase (beta-lactamase superfamily II)
VKRTGIVVAQRLAWEQVKDLCTDSFKQSMVDMLGERDPDMVNLQVVLPQLTFDESAHLHVGDLRVTLLAAAGGIAWVWLSEQRVLFVGDTVVVGTHPQLTVVDIQEWLLALERLRCEPRFHDTVIVPGRGPLCDTSAAEPLTEYLTTACEKTRRVFKSGRPKADLNAVAAELLEFYPVADGQRERVQRQIRLGLDDLYDEYKTADAA